MNIQKTPIVAGDFCLRGWGGQRRWSTDFEADKRMGTDVSTLLREVIASGRIKSQEKR